MASKRKKSSSEPYNSQERKGRSSSSQNRQCQFTDLQLWLLKRSCQKPCGFNIMFAFSRGQFQAPCDIVNRRKGTKSISMSDCVFQGRNYDIFMREINSFVKNAIGHPTYTQPESFMTHKLIKEQRIHRRNKIFKPMTPMNMFY